MLPKLIQKTVDLPDGRTITIETGKLARQADGAVVVRLGNTMLLATVVANIEAREGATFLPLSVDYQEKFASAGKIPGGFLKREGRLSDHEILISRLIDRAIRPLFPDDYHSEIQVVVNLISSGGEVLPDALAALAVSSALSVSDIPFHGPISEVRVVRINGEFKINPSLEEIEEADINMIIAASYENILMVEGEMQEISEAEMIEVIKFGHEAIKAQCLIQKELEKEVGKTEKRAYDHGDSDPELQEQLHKLLYDKIYKVASEMTSDKTERKAKFDAVLDEYMETLPEDDDTINLDLIKKYHHDIEKEAIRNMMLNDGKRLDGRKFDEVRPIWCEVDYLPSTHGSALFTRGETQSLSTVTLGTKLDQKMIDGAVISGTSKFLLHYNFPAFSTGEVRPNRGPGRREVGHGNLALRAIKGTLPSEDENPYTIRIVSDILESNGSSSMATVCAGTMALMDAGVQIERPASGIAMGLISDTKTGKHAILSDILGDEDHLGDMDFKVTGTSKGITACQMDIKVEGLSYDVLAEALEQAKNGRTHILGEMLKTIPESRDDYKPNAPRYVTIKIDKEMIGPLIGPGGKVVQEIQKETKTTVIIEEVDDGGVVNIFSAEKENMEKAVNWVKGIVAVPEVGATYDGVVKNIMPFGAFIEFMPNREGLLHISEIKWERVESMDGVLEIGEEIPIKLLEIDQKTGKYRLSRKALLPRPEKKPDRS